MSWKNMGKRKTWPQTTTRHGDMYCLLDLEACKCIWNIYHNEHFIISNFPHTVDIKLVYHQWHRIGYWKINNKHNQDVFEKYYAPIFVTFAIFINTDRLTDNGIIKSNTTLREGRRNPIRVSMICNPGLCSIVFFNRGQKWWRKLNRIVTSSTLLQNGTYIWILVSIKKQF